MFAGANKLSTCVHVCTRVCVSTGAHDHKPRGKSDGWKSLAVMKGAPTGTGDCFWS